MSSLKLMLDKELENVSLEISASEIEKRHGRKKRVKAAAVSAFVLCVLSAIVFSLNIIIGNLSDTGVPTGFVLKAYALEDSENSTTVSSVKTAISSLTKGVDKLYVTSYYTEDGEPYYGQGGYDGEITEEKICALSIKPVNFHLEGAGREIESYDISCSSNGYLYNQRDYGTTQAFENLKYSELQDVQWMPVCEKLNLVIFEKTGVDASQLQLCLSDSRKVSDAVSSLLQTEEDYNQYFSDEVTLTIHYEDGTDETSTAEITLDENGYYLVNFKEGE